MKKLLLALTASLFLLGAAFAQAPTNDECFTAIPITAQTGNCSSLTYTNNNATLDADDPDPGLCWLQGGASTVPDPPSHTVWFSFVPDSSSVEISTNFTGMTLANTQIAVFSGPCSTLTQISCAEDINSVQGYLHTQIMIHGLTPGDTYYIMVDGNGSQTGTFGLCVQNIPTPGPPLPQQDCVTGSYLCDYQTFSVPNGTGSDGDFPEQPSCFGVTERSSWWYIFTPAQSGPFCYVVTPFTTIDIDVALFDVTGGCPGVELHCNWSGSTANNGVTGLGDAPFCSNPAACDPCVTVEAGHTYAILVDRYTSSSTSGYTVEFASTNPPLLAPTAAFNATTVCAGNPTQFINQSPGGMSTSWNFGDPNATNNNTSTLVNPLHTYSQPGTYTASLTVTVTPGGCQNVFTRQITVLPQPVMMVGPTNPSICEGDAVPISATITPTPPPIPATFSHSTATPIPDFNQGDAVVPIVLTGVAPNNFATNPVMSVCLDIQHSRVSDLELKLVCPDGTILDLALQQGGANPNYSNVCFVPTGAPSITSQNAPFIGDFTPQQPFSNLNSCSINGMWALVVRDRVSDITGTLNYWDITFLSEPRFEWSPGTGLNNTTDAIVNASPAATTTYTATLLSLAGCSADAEITVNVKPRPAAPTATANSPICPGSTLQLSATGPAGATYSWIGPDAFTSVDQNPTLPVFTPANAGLYSVYAIVDGCVSTAPATFTVAVNNSLAVSTAAATPTLCAGQSTTLSASGATTYSWLPSPFLSGTSGAQVTATPTQTTTFTVIGTSSTCSAISTVTVTVNPAPATPDLINPLVTVCEGDDFIIGVNNPQPGTSYQWTGGNGFSSATEINNFTNATTALTGLYSVTATTLGCVSEIAIVAVSVNPTPVLTVSPSATICQGQWVTISASGTNNFSWSPATGLETTTGPVVNASPASTTVYTVSGTSIAGCNKTEQIEVTVSPALNLNAGTDTEICPGTPTVLNAVTTTGGTFVWTPATGLSDAGIANPTATPTATTEYVVNATANGCTETDTVLVTVSSPLQVTVSADFLTGPAPHSVQFTNTTTGATGFSWNFGDDTSPSNEASPQHTYTMPGTYVVVLTSNYGVNCSQTDTVATIIVEPAAQPNIFTPNGDGINDEFKILMTKKPFDLKVMNRWGTEVAEKKNYHLNQNWNGDDLPGGLYFYQITTNDGEIYKGWVEILR